MYWNDGVGIDGMLVLGYRMFACYVLCSMISTGLVWNK